MSEDVKAAAGAAFGPVASPRTDIETCLKCGKTWGVTMPARENIVCSDCGRPPLPEGEVRRADDGVMFVCHGGRPGTFRWRVVGEDPLRTLMHGWRMDHHVADAARLGNVYDLAPEESTDLL